jgi:hypothetical protein
VKEGHERPSVLVSHQHSFLHIIAPSTHRIRCSWKQAANKAEIASNPMFLPPYLSSLPQNSNLKPSSLPVYKYKEGLNQRVRRVWRLRLW